MLNNNPVSMKLTQFFGILQTAAIQWSSDTGGNEHGKNNYSDNQSAGGNRTLFPGDQSQRVCVCVRAVRAGSGNGTIRGRRRDGADPPVPDQCKAVAALPKDGLVEIEVIAEA